MKEVIKAFNDKMSETYLTDAEREVPALITGDARKAAIKQLVEGKQLIYQKHLQVTENTQYAFWVWDDGYDKPNEVEDAWVKTSVTNSSSRQTRMAYTC